MRANRDNWMGSEMNEDNLKLDVFIAGTDIIEKVEIIKDGIVSNVYKPNQKYWSELLEPDFERWRYIYLKATQVDGEIAWSSPVFHC